MRSLVASIILPLCAFVAAAPSAHATVNLVGSGDGWITVRGVSPTVAAPSTGRRVSAVRFESWRSAFPTDGLFARGDFDGAGDTSIVRVDLDAGKLTSRDERVHLPDDDAVRVTLEERRPGREPLLWTALSGEVHVTFPSDGSLTVELGLSATFFPSSGEVGSWREVSGVMHFGTPDTGQTPILWLPVIGVALFGTSTPGSSPPIDPGDPSNPNDDHRPTSSGSGGSGGGGGGAGLGDVVDTVSDVADAASDGCGGDAPSCGDSADCSGGGGDCSGGGSDCSGGGSDCSGGGSACSGATPECAVSASEPRGLFGASRAGTVQRRRPVVLRHLPYAAVFLFIGAMKWRVRRRRRAERVERAESLAPRAG